MDESQNNDETGSRASIADKEFSVDIHHKTPAAVPTKRLFDNGMRDTF
jgi:hypothetical protein